MTSPGAVLVTGGLTCSSSAITQGRGGAGARRTTIGVFALAAVMLVAFVALGAAAEDPLVPFSIFRLQTLTAANIAGFIMGTACSRCS